MRTRIAGRVLRVLFTLLAGLLLLGASVVPPGDPVERIRAFTRLLEFDYANWTINALGVKLGQIALGTANYLTPEVRREQSLAYLDLVSEIQQKEAQLELIYADPNISDPGRASVDLRSELEGLYQRRALLAPLAEAVIQSQVASLADELDLSIAGQSLPPVLYHTTPLPDALIVSPRSEIRQEANISLDPSLTLEDHIALENEVDTALQVSSLVVGIGGVGLYPTMVMQTSDLNWLAEVVAHEWIHNYLTLRPLGMNYLTSPELRTMNETTASIAGKEIGRAVLERYYPERLPVPAPPPAASASSGQEAQAPPPPVFDFRAEMRTTRVTVDELLAEGKVEEAENYMEARRGVFWEHGYRIRKLNQAYFAFHGAYGDQPGGAAGEDPVGAAVRELRARSSTLAEFINRMAWLSSYEQLLETLQ